MSGGWFITGTDTGVGKTRIACMILAALAQRGMRAVGMKPVASGCTATHTGLGSGDAELLLASSSVSADYGDINPYAFAPPCAPAIAAREANVEIRLDKILLHFRRLQQAAQWVIVEGIGGWTVPLGDRLSMPDVAREIGLPVILVVGMRLGCINHAMLTASAVRHAGIRLSGWIANQIDPAMTRVDESIIDLARSLELPLIARFPYQPPKGPCQRLPEFPLHRLLP
ncbi:MAG: dethiobiotin synthase [Sulfuricaulis sp.]|uniref:dethiobiotin synthase n=1 Tax=Sulfuricaulis sp. TaxID=2003553 RepID=UPI0034A4E8EC